MQIIIEVNTATPSFEGLHDITMTDLPPRRKPYLIMAPEDRIGTPYIPVDPERVVAVVESDYPDQTVPNAPEDETSRAIAANLIEFLKHEVSHGRLPESLLPIQSGIGNIANAVIGGLSGGHANFKNLKVWTEVLQDSFLDLFDSGNLVSSPGYNQFPRRKLTYTLHCSRTSRPLRLSASVQTAFTVSTSDGGSTPRSSCYAANRSPIILRSSDALA